MKITIKREQRKTRFGLLRVSNLRDVGANKILYGIFALVTIVFTGCNAKDPVYDATFEIRITDNGNGIAKAAIEGADASSAGTGTIVTITATPDAEYLFKQWIVVSGGTDAMLSSTANSTATFIMPANDVEIRAEFQYLGDYINTFLSSATIAYDDEASDATKTVYTFSLPNAPTGVEIGSTTVTSGAANINSSLSGNAMTITSAAMESAEGPAINVEFTATYESVTSTATATLTVPFTGAAKNAVGAGYYQNGIATGMVYIINSGIGTGRAVSLKEAVDLEWITSDGVNTSETDEYDGLANMETIKRLDPSFSAYPAFSWVDAMNGVAGTTAYSPGATGIWYLPAMWEAQDLHEVWNGATGATEMNGMRTTFNGWLTDLGGTVISPLWYWTSSKEYTNDINFYACIYLEHGSIIITNNSTALHRIRAIMAF